MSDDESWDTEADYVAPPDSKGNGGVPIPLLQGRSSMSNPFTEIEEHRKSEEEARNSRASAAEAAAPRVAKPSAFGGGGGEKCDVCSKTVYAAEKTAVGTLVFHKECFRCAESTCNKKLISDYNMAGGRPFCWPHFSKLPKEAKEPTSSRGDGVAVAAAAPPPPPPWPTARVSRARAPAPARVCW